MDDIKLQKIISDFLYQCPELNSKFDIIKEKDDHGRLHYYLRIRDYQFGENYKPKKDDVFILVPHNFGSGELNSGFELVFVRQKIQIRKKTGWNNLTNIHDYNPFYYGEILPIIKKGYLWFCIMLPYETICENLIEFYKGINNWFKNQE